MKKWKRFLSVVLTLVMVLGMLPMTALAEEVQEAADLNGSIPGLPDIDEINGVAVKELAEKLMTNVQEAGKRLEAFFEKLLSSKLYCVSLTGDAAKLEGIVSANDVEFVKVSGYWWQLLPKDTAVSAITVGETKIDVVPEEVEIKVRGIKIASFYRIEVSALPEEGPSVPDTPVEPAEPEVPSAEELAELLNAVVLLQCGKHEDGRYTELLADSYEIGTVTYSSAQVTVKVDQYLAKYNEGKTAAHKLAAGDDGVETFGIHYNSETGKWEQDAKLVMLLFGMECPTEPEVPVVPEIDKPTKEELDELINPDGTVKIAVECTTNAEHAKTYGLIDGGYEVGEVQENTCQVTIKASVYQAQYNTDSNSKHELTGTDKTVTLTWDAEQGAWTAQSQRLVISVQCEEKQPEPPIVPDEPKAPEKPGKDEIAPLLGGDGKVKVNVVCTTVSGHSQVYGWVDGGVSVGEVVQTGDVYTCNVTFNGSAYAAKYNDDTKTKHDFEAASETITLTWDGEAWTVADGLVTFYVACELPAEPDEDGLIARKWVSAKTAEVGEVIVYTLKVVNGTGADLEDVLISDPLLDLYIEVDLDEDEVWEEKYAYCVSRKYHDDTLYNTFYVSLDGKEWTDSNTVSTEIDGWSWHVNLNKKDHMAYIEGYGDDTVRPESNITRAEIATIFYRLLTEDSRTAYKTSRNPFSDVNSGDWYNTAVSTMANAGVMSGYPDGTFRPNEAITRAELASVVACFVDWGYDYDGYFYDVDGKHWASEEIAIARYFGWIEGYGDGSFRPDAKITRAETVTLINRVLERAVEQEEMLKGMITFDDCDPGDWYYEEIQEAANSHTYTRTHQRVPGQSFYYESWAKLIN